MPTRKRVVLTILIILIPSIISILASLYYAKNNPNFYASDQKSFVANQEKNSMVSIYLYDIESDFSPPYTHQFDIDESAESVLGEEDFNRLSEILTTSDSISSSIQEDREIFYIQAQLPIDSLRDEILSVLKKEIPDTQFGWEE